MAFTTRQETFWGLHGQRAVVTIGSSWTTITIYEGGEYVVLNQNIVDYGVKNGHLCYTEVAGGFGDPVTHHEVVDFEVRPTISWR